MTDIRAVPELNQWYLDATAAAAGDKTKSSAQYEYATQMDKMLQSHPVWKTRPQGERFAEVAKRVKADLGIQSGSLESQDGDPGKEIDDAIRKQGGGEGLPGTMSDLDGGNADAGGAMTLEAVDKMDIAELASRGFSSDQLERLSAAIQ